MRIRMLAKFAILCTAGIQLSACVVFVPLLESDYVPAHEASCPLSGSVSQYAHSKKSTSALNSPRSKQAHSKQAQRYRPTPSRLTQVAPVIADASSKMQPLARKVRLSLRNKTLAKASGKTRVDSLISQLGHSNDVVRTHAATDLGMLGSKAQRAVVPLSNALERDSSKWVRRAAVKALAKIGTPDVLGPLTLALHDSNKYVAHSAKQALRRLRRSSRSLGPL